MAFSTLAAKLTDPRPMTAMLPATLAGQSLAARARPQSTSVPVTPRELVDPANSAERPVVSPTAASRPVPVGTDDATSTPGADRSRPAPWFEKLARDPSGLSAA